VRPGLRRRDIIRALRRRRSGASAAQGKRGSGIIVVTGGGVTALVGYGWIMVFFVSLGRLPIEAAGSWNVLFGALLVAVGLLGVLVGAIVAALRLDSRRAVG
jgi:hypothetical protein